MRRQAGFTLLEALLAFVILATCLAALGATLAQGISSADESINQRAAREACRAKLEEFVATGDSSGGGIIEGHDSFTWNATREERVAGAIDSPDEKYDMVTVTVTYPSDTAPSSPNVSAGKATVKLATLTDPPDLNKNPAAPGTGK